VPNFVIDADKITVEKDVLETFWQYEIPLWLVILLLLIMLVVPMEVGFRLGRRQRRLYPDAERAARNDVTLASILALLGLCLHLPTRLA
jgi:hypothetical protein